MAETMPRRATIRDVAQRAGVSKSTVSLVLQGSQLVRDSTRAQVEVAMAELDYVYNRAAAGLRGAAKGLVGLVINDLRNPFFTEFAASAQMGFAERGFATVIANTDEDPALQAQVIDSMIEHGVTAMVISPAYGDPSGFDRIARAGVPCMQVLRMVDPRTDLFPFASLDYAEGGRLAARHLVEAGARRIAFVGGLEDRPITLERMQGYAGVMEAEGRAPRVFPGRPSRSFGRELALELARSHPEVDAAVCFSDLVALGMLSGFAEAGVPLGEAFRLVGFDDIEECSLVYPQLSSVRCNTTRFGRDAARTLLAWIDDGERPPDTRRLPVELVARRSSLGETR
ncbi:LacI family DNA-binding transcriptional regulator [Roseivivax sp. GX 12232]|uniref:LacI family DNA-binding transcriptional regulator n=1 Tax=Roseivivax sp. GX 12232 TaxID=2900547 RepID=UPI001E34ABF0|nr:LacI family DNA-binding transcriptional regulator [Roseivivax sp. GX 12232]MCE0505049.1 LacI family DNA-binding transcriptional regulator [Roseivivax sp. GX 12232]